jgi:hypothetical protein
MSSRRIQPSKIVLDSQLLMDTQNMFVQNLKHQKLPGQSRQLAGEDGGQYLLLKLIKLEMSMRMKDVKLNDEYTAYIAQLAASTVDELAVVKTTTNRSTNKSWNDSTEMEKLLANEARGLERVLNKIRPADESVVKEKRKDNIQPMKMDSLEKVVYLNTLRKENASTSELNEACEAVRYSIICRMLIDGILESELRVVMWALNRVLGRGLAPSSENVHLGNNQFFHLESAQVIQEVKGSRLIKFQTKGDSPIKAVPAHVKEGLLGWANVDADIFRPAKTKKSRVTEMRSPECELTTDGENQDEVKTLGDDSSECSTSVHSSEQSWQSTKVELTMNSTTSMPADSLGREDKNVNHVEIDLTGHPTESQTVMDEDHISECTERRSQYSKVNESQNQKEVVQAEDHPVQTKDHLVGAEIAEIPGEEMSDQRNAMSAQVGGDPQAIKGVTLKTKVVKTAGLIPVQSAEKVRIPKRKANEVEDLADLDESSEVTEKPKPLAWRDLPNFPEEGQFRKRLHEILKTVDYVNFLGTNVNSAVVSITKAVFRDAKETTLKGCRRKAVTIFVALMRDVEIQKGAITEMTNTVFAQLITLFDLDGKINKSGSTSTGQMTARTETNVSKSIPKITDNDHDRQQVTLANRGKFLGMDIHKDLEKRLFAAMDKVCEDLEPIQLITREILLDPVHRTEKPTESNKARIADENRILGTLLSKVIVDVSPRFQRHTFESAIALFANMKKLDKPIDLLPGFLAMDLDERDLISFRARCMDGSETEGRYDLDSFRLGQMATSVPSLELLARAETFLGMQVIALVGEGKTRFSKKVMRGKMTKSMIEKYAAAVLCRCISGEAPVCYPLVMSGEFGDNEFIKDSAITDGTFTEESFTNGQFIIPECTWNMCIELDAKKNIVGTIQQACELGTMIVN